MRRYFILSYYQKHSGGGISGSKAIITDNRFPSKKDCMSAIRIYSNELSTIQISEVKSIQDLKDWFGREIPDVLTNFSKEEEEEDWL